MQGHKYSHICNLCCKFLSAGMICTTINTISIPVGEMYLHERMFFALAHTSSITIGAINFYMQERFYTRSYHFYSHVCDVFICKNVLYTCAVHLLFPWVQCQSLKPVLSQCSETGFVTVDDFIALCTPSYVFYSHECNKFLHARTFFTLADTTSIPMLIHLYSYGCNVRAGNLF